MSAETAPTTDLPAGPSVVERLRNVTVGVREDLEVTRHLFRGKPAYVIRDPMTFQSHRLDPGDYAIFISIAPDRPLGRIYQGLVESGVIEADSEELFYQFIVTLHRINFLNLPIADDKLLYKRYIARKRAKRKQKLLGALFLRIPLVNPDAFLDKTIRYARPVFSRWFFGLWLCLMAAAVFVAMTNAGRLVEPVQGVLAAHNLALMWATLIVLKVLHELGHAYACKYFGGYVPETGVYLIVLTPLTYVDASSVWGFSRRRDRLMVCLAGMYFESMVAAAALFTWAATTAGVVHDIAYNVIFLASVVTVLFNINPLMRYDGYYALTDLLEIPNLRQRSTKYVISVFKRIGLGMPIPDSPRSLPLRALLLVFGIASNIYRMVIILVISALVASKMFLVGLGIAVSYVTGVTVSIFRRMIEYMWFSPQTQPVRVRAVAVSLVVMVMLPLAILLVPIRSNVRAVGVVGTEREAVIRARVDGFVERTHAEPGQLVRQGALVVELVHDARLEAIAQARTQVEVSEIRHSAYQVADPVRARQEQQNSTVYRLELDRRRAELDDLKVEADITGRIVHCLDRRNWGQFVRTGEPLAMIAAGCWQVRAILTEQQVADARPAVGDAVNVRAAAMPGCDLRGVIARIVPAGSRRVEDESLTQLGGGGIAVDPLTRQAGQPYFEVAVNLPVCDAQPLRHGMSCDLRFGAAADSLGTILIRHLMRFSSKLMQG